MPKARTIILIVATVLVVSGCVIMFGSFAIAGFDFQKVSTTPIIW